MNNNNNNNNRSTRKAELKSSGPVAAKRSSGKHKMITPTKVITVSPGPGKKVLTGKGKYKAKNIENLPWYEQAGRDLGGALGKAGYGLFKTLTGFGDYNIDTNSILAEATEGANGSTIPMMVNSKVSNIFRHREFIGNVRGSTTDFNTQTFNINPGLDDVFPWGFALANCYTSYRMRGLVFEYISLSSEYTATPYMGYVAMGSQYNVLDAPFPDRKALLNSEYSCSTKPSKNLMHPIECSPAQLPFSQLMVRSGDPPTNADARIYDLCKFTIATGGQTSNGIIGELWATYEIELYQPKLVGSVGSLVNSDHWRGQADASGKVFANPTPRLGNTLGAQVAHSSITFPKTVAGGTYLIAYSAVGSTDGDRLGSWQPVSNCYAIQNSFSSFPSVQAYASTTIMSSIRVRITGESAELTTVSVGPDYPLLSTGTWDLYITQLPSSVALDGSEDTVIVTAAYAQELMRKERLDFMADVQRSRLDAAVKAHNLPLKGETRTEDENTENNRVEQPRCYPHYTPHTHTQYNCQTVPKK